MVKNLLPPHRKLAYFKTTVIRVGGEGSDSRSLISSGDRDFSRRHYFQIRPEANQASSPVDTG